MADAHVNFAISSVATAPSPAVSGVSVVLAAGEGVRFPVVPFSATVGPNGAVLTSANSEIVRVTARSVDTLTITRSQESSTARTILAGDQFFAGITAKMLTDADPSGGPGAVQYNNSGVQAGAAKVDVGSSGSLQFAVDAAPPTPPANELGVFARSVAGRLLLAQVGPSGLDTSLQPLLARNKIGYWNPQGNSTVVPGVFGFTAPTVVGTATARNVVTTNGATRMRRLGFVSAATAGALTEARVAVAQFTAGSGVNDGSGVFYVTRWVASNAAAVAGERFFIGLSSTIAAATNVEPNTLQNSIGVAQLSTDATQYYLICAGLTAQTAIPLGTALGAPNTLSTAAFELALFSPNSLVNTWNVQVTNIFTGVAVTQTLSSANGNAAPGSGLLLAHKAWKTNNATALAVGFDICSIYIETDT